MQVVHKNDLFEGPSNENAKVVVDIGDYYGTKDVSLCKELPLALDHNIVSSTEMVGLKDDQRTELLSDSRHSVSDQDSVDTRDLSPSKVFNESFGRKLLIKGRKRTRWWFPGPLLGLLNNLHNEGFLLELSRLW